MFEKVSHCEIKNIVVTRRAQEQLNEIVEYMGLDGDMEAIFGAVMNMALSDYHNKLMEQKRIEQEQWAFVAEFRNMMEGENNG